MTRDMTKSSVESMRMSLFSSKSASTRPLSQLCPRSQSLGPMDRPTLRWKIIPIAETSRKSHHLFFGVNYYRSRMERMITLSIFLAKRLPGLPIQGDDPSDEERRATVFKATKRQTCFPAPSSRDMRLNRGRGRTGARDKQEGSLTLVPQFQSFFLQRQKNASARSTRAKQRIPKRESATMAANMSG